MEEKITSFDTAILIVSILVGIGVLSLPRTVAEMGGSSGIIFLIASGIVQTLSALLISWLMLANQKDTLSESLEGYFGKYVAKFITLAIAVYFIFFAAILVRTIGEINSSIILDATPYWANMIGLLIIVVFCVRRGLSVVTSVQNILFFLKFIVGFGLALFLINKLELNNFLPFWQETKKPLHEGIISMYFSYAGIAILYFLIPYLKDKYNLYKGVIGGMAFTTFFYTFIFTMVILFFGTSSTITMKWPTFEYYDTVDIPFITDVTSYISAVWVMAGFSVTTLAFFLPSKGAQMYLN